VIASSAKAKLLVFAVFFVGAITGALVANVYETRWSVDADSAPEKQSQRQVNQFYDFLDLTAEQRQQWTRIMEDSRPAFQKLNEENRKLTEHNQPKFEAIREETRAKIRAILTDEQKKKYNEFNERRRKQRQNQTQGQTESQSRPK